MILTILSKTDLNTRFNYCHNLFSWEEVGLTWLCSGLSLGLWKGIFPRNAQETIWEPITIILGKEIIHEYYVIHVILNFSLLWLHGSQYVPSKYKNSFIIFNFKINYNTFSNTSFYNVKVKNINIIVKITFYLNIIYIKLRDFKGS